MADFFGWPRESFSKMFKGKQEVSPRLLRIMRLEIELLGLRGKLADTLVVSFYTISAFAHWKDSQALWHSPTRVWVGRDRLETTQQRAQRFATLAEARAVVLDDYDAKPSMYRLVVGREITHHVHTSTSLVIPEEDPWQGDTPSR